MTSASQQARGVLLVHSAPGAMCPHIEWSVGSVFGVQVSLQWTPQPAQPRAFRAEYTWTGLPGSAAAVTSAMKGWDQVRFEVTEDPSPGYEGSRYAYTPSLGVFHATTSPHGDIMIPEERIKFAMLRAASGESELLNELDRLLGTAWDAELETFRHAGDGAPVKWLHQVV